MKTKNYYFINLTGQRFGRLLVLYKTKERKNKCVIWFCICDCGVKCKVVGNLLTKGDTRSCGCLQRDWAKSFFSNLNKTHGKTGDRLFNVYRGILRRCFNPHEKAYPYYGGRGIVVCKRWLGKKGFIHFEEDMGKEYRERTAKGEQISIDRLNVDKNYMPSNCKWSTSSEQNRNKRTSSKTKNFDQHHYMQHTLQRIVWAIMRINRQYSKYDKYFGCTSQELRKHIQSLWEPWMNWDNYGPYQKNKLTWQVDHIVPVHKFDLANEADLYECWNYKNLRPFLSSANLKRNKISLDKQF